MRILLVFVLFVLSDPMVIIAQEHSHHGVQQHEGGASDSDEISFWTCSMHPQIKLPEPGQCPICNMDLIPVQKTTRNSSSDTFQLRLSKTAEKLARVEVAPAVRKMVTKEIQMVGTLDFDETRLTNITAWVPGRIDRMFVDYTGIRVKKGEHMLEIYSPELLSAQEELIQASKSLGRLRGSGSELVRKSTEQALRSSREKLQLLGLTEGQVREIEKSGTPGDQVTIYAPAGGVVIERNATEGMYVQTGTKIYAIADLSSLWLHLDAYESDLPWIRYGQKVTFTTGAIPGKTFEGVISFISPVVDIQTRTTRVRVNIDNSSGILKPGLFVNGVVKSEIYGEAKVIDTSLKGKYIGPMHPEIIRDKPGKCPICGMNLVPAEELGYITDDIETPPPLVVPVTAPLLTGKRAVVYVRNKNGAYELRNVLLGPRAENFYIIESGLQEGELVVVNGAFRIDADIQIKGETSMMNPEGMDVSGEHAHH